MHLLEREIVLNTGPARVWEFLATPVNLNELTPPGLDFRIISELPDKMYNGLLIEYAISIPMFPGLSTEEQDTVVSALAKALG